MSSVDYRQGRFWSRGLWRYCVVWKQVVMVGVMGKRSVGYLWRKVCRGAQWWLCSVSCVWFEVEEVVVQRMKRSWG